MLLKPSAQVNDCLERARLSREKADKATVLQIKQDFLDLERRWLRLAESYGYAERTSDFIREAERSREANLLSDDEIQSLAERMVGDRKTTDPTKHLENNLLARLPEVAMHKLAPHLAVRQMNPGEVLAETDSAIDQVYFPHSGVVSLVVEMQEGGTPLTAMIGRDGVVNGGIALCSGRSLNKAEVLIEATASVIKASALRILAFEVPELQSVLLRYEQYLFAAAQQSAACNASHLVEQRLCSSLLRLSDLAGDNFGMNQHTLGYMLGVRRTSVTVAANALKSAGLIGHGRGKIVILESNGLKQRSCECYEVANQKYDRLFSGER